MIKHLFYIHSFITYIVSISTIKELNIDSRDVVFIYGRGFHYPPPDGIKSFQLADHIMALDKVPTYGQRLLAIRMFWQIRTLDHIIALAIGKCSFSAYLPHVKNYLMSLITTHRQCVNLSFIEEGLLTYTGNLTKKLLYCVKSNPLGTAKDLMRFINHANRSVVYKPIKSGYPHVVYMIDNDTDKTTHNIRVLQQLQFPDIDYAYIYDNSYLLIVDIEFSSFPTDTSEYWIILDRFLSLHQQDSQNKIFIRFRPNYAYKEPITSFLFSRGITPIILPDSVCVESILRKAHNMTVVGLHSSLLFYAALWGHSSYSMLDLLYAINHSFTAVYDRLTLPTTFYRRVTQVS